MDRFVGKKLDGRYEIEGLIGIGGMANVYRAYDVIDDRVVAIKILRDEHMSNDELLRRFRNESKAISVLSHPNIVKVFDVSFNDRVQYIVMEYIDGITLKEYIEQQGVIRWKEAVHFLVQILRALQHAHDKGIVHRDIKPQNMMLLRDGTIKITDFGIARFARNDDSTLSDRTIGSVHYISPEQAQGEVTDGRTDIYSVGVIMYEMLTGQLPFEADTPVSVALKQIELEPKRPRQINPSVPEGLEAIVMWAMQKDVNKRYQTAAEMLRDIDEFKRNPSVHFEYSHLIDKQAQEAGEYTAETAKPVRMAAPERKVVSVQTKQRKWSQYTESVAEAEGRRKLSPILPVLFGVMVAFIVVSVLFIAAMFWLVDPLAKTEDVIVPNLVGESFETLKGNENYDMFQFDVAQPDYNDKYGKGYIYEQEPEAGRTVKAGSKITVYVSLGPNKLIMPNVVEYDMTSAYQMLAEYNVICTPIEEYSDISEGFVIRTEPVAGEELKSGQEVIIYVSRGPQTQIIQVPDLDGMTLSGAKTYLAAYGLKVGVVRKVESSKDSGTVIDQDPKAGDSIEKGGYVNLDISEGPIGSDQAQIELKVVLPNLNERIYVEAVLTLDELSEDEQPESVRDRVELAIGQVWTCPLEGTGTGTVHVYIDGILYRTYEVDFDEQSYSQLRDYSEEFLEQYVPGVYEEEHADELGEESNGEEDDSENSSEGDSDSSDPDDEGV
ncbi:MAG: Stk1 family PASTA domain-containing Ser/Thr kinase [Ruminococcaceae bacterium]|nr:Stk1 family PASTA domain-containing Ser/Thr kinase [Oscillospiraceae bacterium]